MQLNLDDKFLNHLGYLYMRDALVIYEDRIELDDEKSSAHYENI